LLSLEEPPKNVVFFLLCKDATLLLETIRSRAVLLRTTPLSKEQILRYADMHIDTGLSTDALDKLATLSRGSLGYFKDMLDSGKSDALIKSRETSLLFVSGMLNLDTGSANLIYSMFSWQRDRVKEIFNLSLLALRDLAVVKKARGTSLCFFVSYDEASTLASRYSLKKILKLIDAINVGIESFQVNASVAGVLASILTYCK
jgi:DNA polymerase III delta prime subunit